MNRVSLVVISIILSVLIMSCGNASTTSEKAPKEEGNITTSEAPTIAEQEAKEESIDDNDTTSTIVDEETVFEEAKDADIDWKDYVDSGGVFNMDNYAEALGYTVIKADKSNSWYIFDVDNYHYCIIAYRDTLNIMFDSYDVGYAINVTDSLSNAMVAEQCIQSDKCSVSAQWLDETASLLNYITNGPSEEEIRNYSGIETIHLSCTKWSECFVTDKRGVIVDNTGSAEPLWNRNWENDD